MRKKRQLDKLKMIREIHCQKVRESLVTEQSRLALEEQRLKQLQDYQGTYAWEKERQASGLALNSAQMMVANIEKAITHQQQQVAVQTASCRTVQDHYMLGRRHLKTAESLVERHQKVLNRKEARQEQKIQDEWSARSVRAW